MTEQTSANQPLNFTITTQHISITHLTDVTRTAKLRAAGLLESLTFLEAHIQGLPCEYRGIKGVEMVAAIAALMECAQTTLENMARAQRTAQR